MSDISIFDQKERFLSADVLFDCVVSAKPCTLPTIGEKKDERTGSFLEGKHIQSRLRSLRDAIAYPRVSQRSQLSEGSWDQELKLVRVTKAVGRYWETFGHLMDGENRLNPEEALFLLECNNLAVTFGGVDMSVQQGYEIFLNDGYPLEEYFTFATLSRLGYKVVRHQGDLGITLYERQIRLDLYQKKRKNKDRGCPDRDVEPDEPSAKKSADAESACGKAEANTIVEQVIIDDPKEATDNLAQNDKKSSNVECSAKAGNYNDQNVGDVEYDPTRSGVDLDLSDVEYIPTYIPRSGEQQNSSDDDYDPCYRPTSSDGKNVKEGQLAVLWQACKTTPRLSPSEATSSSAIQSKLRFKSPSHFPESTGRKLKISYDVYLPSVTVRKSVPKLPNYRIVVVKSDSPIPTSADVKATVGALKDGVPIIFAVVATSSVSFYSFAHICLPPNPSIDDDLM